LSACGFSTEAWEESEKNLEKCSGVPLAADDPFSLMRASIYRLKERGLNLERSKIDLI